MTGHAYEDLHQRDRLFAPENPKSQYQVQVPHITLYAVDHTSAGASSTIRTLRPITMAKTYICTYVSE